MLSSGSERESLAVVALKDVVLPALQTIAVEDLVSASEITDRLGLDPEDGTPENQWATVSALYRSADPKLVEQASLMSYQALLNLEVIDSVGEVLREALSNWKGFLIKALGGLIGDSKLIDSGAEIVIGNGVRLHNSQVRELVEAEYRLADWFIGLVAYRAVGFRHDLEDVRELLPKFIESRNGLKFTFCDQRGHKKSCSLRNLSAEREIAFLSEIQSSVENVAEQLEMENLPEVLTRVVYAQALQPVGISDLDLLLADVQVPVPQPAKFVGHDDFSDPEELQEDLKSRAAAILIDIARSVSAFNDRAWCRATRCADLDELQYHDVSVQTEILQALSEVENELQVIIPYPRKLASVMAQIKDAVFSGYEPNWERRVRPYCYLHVIDAEDMIGTEPVGMFIHVSWHDLELPLGPEDEEAADSSGFDSEEVSYEIDNARSAVEPEKSEDEADIGADQLSDEVVPLSVTRLVVRGGRDREFFSFTGDLSKWFHNLADRIEKGTENQDPESDTKVALYQQEEGGVAMGERPAVSWRYFGLSQDQCQKQFVGMFKIFEIYFPTAWDLIPDNYKAELSIPEIDEFSISDLAIELVRLLQAHYDRIATLPPSSLDRIRDWLVVFGRDCDVTTADMLYTVSRWGDIAKIYSGAESWENTFFQQLADHPMSDHVNYCTPELHLISVVLSESEQSKLISLMDSGKIILDGWTEHFLSCIRRCEVADIVRAIEHFKNLELSKVDKRGRIIGSLSPSDWIDDFVEGFDNTEASARPRLRSSCSTVWDNISRAILRHQI